MNRFTFEFQQSMEELSRSGRFLEMYSDAAQAGESLARDLNKSVLDAAFAGAGGLVLRDKHAPSQSDKPLIVVGCSGGAPAAVAFASLHRDHLAGLILVGAGGDLVELLQRTDLNSDRDVVKWRDDTPLSEQQRALATSFNSHCLVDPLITGKSIPTDRVLMVHARFDSVVPSDLGDKLWESLGRPERWKFFGGHRLLFYRLSSYSKDLANWAESRAWAFPGTTVPN
ncbi:MAG: alpha/beta hydrolase [Phycisphaerales bacterium]|nr:alpha/beta hydrolase [Phycisphaerales bacterium]